jgi:hypothetical protein
MGETAVSLLVMELVMLCASRGYLISEVRIFPSFAFIPRALHAPSMPAIALDSLYSMRGIDVIGADEPDLVGARRLTKHLFGRVPDKLRRVWNRMRR